MTIALFALALAALPWVGMRAHDAAAAARASVQAVRFGQHTDKTRLVIEMSAPADFRAFVLTAPDRLVIDLPAFDWRVGTISRPAGTDVTDIRQGPTQPGISRIVLDMKRPIGIRGAMALPRDNGANDRIVIDYAPTANPAGEKGKVFGRLRVDDRIGNADLAAPGAATASSPAHQASAATGEPRTQGAMAVPAKKPPMPANQRPVIIIDAGHGGEDPGAIGSSGLKEKNITLAMARDLKKALEDSGRYRVVMTRETDTYLKLWQRVDIARANNADLFISLHADSMDRHNVSGASIYTLSEKASDSESARLAERENQADLIAGVDLRVEDAEVASILVDLAMRDTMNQSKFFANIAVDAMQDGRLRLLDNPHRYAGFAVLKAPDVPSVLVETGFMSNSREAQMLNTPAHRAKIAAALVRAIDGYFDTVRHNRSN